MENKSYHIRQNILKALEKYDIACMVDDILDFDGFLFIKPTLDEVRAEWHKLRQAGLIEAFEEFGGEYCRITAKGLQQVNPEYKKDVFVWGPRALKAIAFLLISVALLAGNGCGLAVKSAAMANSADAFAVAPDIANGTVTYRIIAGGNANTIVLQLPYEADKNYPTLIAYSKRQSMWGMFSGDTTCGNVSVSFAGGNDLTPEQQIRLIEALAKFVNPTIEAVKETETQAETATAKTKIK